VADLVENEIATGWRGFRDAVEIGYGCGHVENAPASHIMTGKRRAMALALRPLQHSSVMT